MSGTDSQLNWTEEQWTKVRLAVQETAQRARVASVFLPLVGPLPSSQTTVPSLVMSELENNYGSGQEQVLSVTRRDVTEIVTISTDIYLRASEVNDPDLSAAIAMFARSAEVLARVEDSIVFNGLKAAETLNVEVNPKIYHLNNEGQHEGLLPTDKPTGKTEKLTAANLVTEIVNAVETLEKAGHYGPFACVLGHELFLAANSPSDSMVLPSDRITPFLNGGPLLRSSVINAKQGVVVALAGDPVDLVVATDMSVNFLQISTEPRFVFRVHERIALRIKQQGAICVLKLN